VASLSALVLDQCHRQFTETFRKPDLMQLLQVLFRKAEHTMLVPDLKQRLKFRI
jgi:hypothetical protein